MDDQAQGVEVQRRRSRAEAEQVASEYEGSGLSRVEFCRKHGLSLATLARYRKRQAQGKAEPGNRWVTGRSVGRKLGAGESGKQRSGGRIAGWPSHRSWARV
jgi:hypothetical protein